MSATGYTTAASARRAARRLYGKDSVEGYDWEIGVDGLGRWDHAPGSKYDTKQEANRDQASH